MALTLARTPAGTLTPTPTLTPYSKRNPIDPNPIPNPNPKPKPEPSQVAFVVLLLATRNLVVAALATLTITMCILTVLGTIQMMGWKLGFSEVRARVGVRVRVRGQVLRVKGSGFEVRA